MEFTRRRRSHRYIDMAPLVDVVFLLLLFFMLTFHMIMEPAIKIQLPTSRTAAAHTQNQIVVSISRQGVVYVGDQAVALPHLAALIRQRLKAAREPSVTIKADRAASVGLLVQVVDGVRLAGCAKFSIVTERR